MIAHIVKATGKRSARNSHAAFDEGGQGSPGLYSTEKLLMGPEFVRDESDKADKAEHGFADFPECFEDRYAEKMECNQRQ